MHLESAQYVCSSGFKLPNVIAGVSLHVCCARMRDGLLAAVSPSPHPAFHAASCATQLQAHGRPSGKLSSEQGHLGNGTADDQPTSIIHKPLGGGG